MRRPVLTLTRLCAAVPAMCRLARLPDVTDALSAPAEGRIVAVQTAAARHPREVRAALAPFFSGRPPRWALRRLPERLHPWLSLCSQCTPAEMLSVLTKSTVLPTADCAALLLSTHRQENDRRLYAVQLLWRNLGDPSIPDAFAVFAPQEVRTGREIRDALLTQLRNTPERRESHA